MPTAGFTIRLQGGQAIIATAVVYSEPMAKPNLPEWATSVEQDMLVEHTSSVMSICKFVGRLSYCLTATFENQSSCLMQFSFLYQATHSCIKQLANTDKACRLCMSKARHRFCTIVPHHL